MWILRGGTVVTMACLGLAACSQVRPDRTNPSSDVNAAVSGTALPLDERLATLRLGMSPAQVVAILRPDLPGHSRVVVGRPSHQYLYIADLEIAEPVEAAIKLRYFHGGLTSWRLDGDWVDVSHVPGTCKRCGWPRPERPIGDARRPTEPPDSRSTNRDAATERVYKQYFHAVRQLNETVLDFVHLDDIPFEQAIQVIQENTHLTVQPAWGPLSASGVDRETPVSLRLRRVKLDEFIDLLLANVAPDGEGIGYDVVGDVLVISTRADLHRRVPVMTRRYFVRDLEGIDFEGAIDRLADLIRRSVRPNTWHGNGGDIGTISHDGDYLIISHTSAVHCSLDDMFKQLRTPRCSRCLADFGSPEKS